MRCIVILIVLSLYSIGGTQGDVDCPVCDRDSCAPIGASCSHSRKVLDECNCCTVCPKMLGENCGSGNGRCDRSLVCIKSNPWSNEGTCQEVDPEILDCTNVVCTEEQVLECNEGEFYRPGKINNCCVTPGKCVCRRSACTKPNCTEGALAVMVMPAELSGACCDSYTCIQIDVPLTNIMCKEDSVWNEETETCECMTCDEIYCPEGFSKVTESLGTGEPGTCCDQKFCLPVYNETCIHRGIVHFKNERWYPDACHNCICLRGRTVCIQNSCPPLTCPATQQVYPEGACCPVCQDSETEPPTATNILITTDSIPTASSLPPLTDFCLATNMTRVPVGTEWEEGCQSCSCRRKGATVCTEFSCPRLKCKISTIHPGECCPKCSEEITLDACELKSGELTYEGSIIRTQLLDDMGETAGNEACQNCRCTSNELECAIGPCDPTIGACNSLQSIGLDNLPNWLDEYGVVYMFNSTRGLDPAMICSYLEYNLISNGYNRAIQIYTHGDYQHGISYFVMTVSELLNKSQYHAFKSQQETIALLQAIHNPSFLSLKQVLALPELQSPNSILFDNGHFSTNMLILYSITGAFSTILIIIIMIMIVVSAYTLSKMHRDGAFPWQKKRCTTPSSIELNLGTVNRGSQLSPPLRYVEFQTKISSQSKDGSNSAGRSCPV